MTKEKIPEPLTFLGLENPDDLKKAEIVVGIPSYNEAEGIALPTAMADEGLHAYFKTKQAAIINCDACSTDNTKEVFLGVKTATPKIYLSTPPGVTGKGNNIRNLFIMARRLGARAIIMVDADLKSITPKWIKMLGEPIFSGFGYVAPLYVRHKYNSTITNNIAYPFSRMLYGRRVRQPIGGDFGFSGRLLPCYLNLPLWSEDVSQFGIDIWMTTIAMMQKMPICQSFMGRPKIHRAKDPGAQLGPMFKQVIGTIFAMMGQFSNYWSHVKWSKPTSIFGFGLGDIEEPPPLEVNEDNLYQKFLDGFTNYSSVWEQVLQRETYKKLVEIKGLSPGLFNVPPLVWALILFDFAVAYHKAKIDRSTLLEALMPLYFGKTLSFVKKAGQMSIQEAEEQIESESMVFEEAKPYLVRRWSIL
ncbi:MAG: glycosyl transferase [Thermodesulfobacteriota bacterium]|nr:glycosyl transferase [Thermodesulfobacteriota bacterium]